MAEERSLLWKETFNIRAYEVGQNGRVTIQSLCNYLQEAASNHAHHLGVSVEQLIRQQLTWVLSRFHVRINNYPYWRQAVTIETWPSDKDNLYALRDFRLFHDGKEIGVATSSWMLINVQARKPVPLPDFLNEIKNDKMGRALADTFQKLPKSEDFEFERSFDVRLSDLDMNRHVNNVIYIDWGLESLPAEIYHNNILQDLEISYRAESFLGDQVISKSKVTATEGLKIIHHSLIRKSDDKELCQMMTTWIPK